MIQQCRSTDDYKIKIEMHVKNTPVYQLSENISRPHKYSVNNEKRYHKWIIFDLPKMRKREKGWVNYEDDDQWNDCMNMKQYETCHSEYFPYQFFHIDPPSLISESIRQLSYHHPYFYYERNSS